MGMIISYIGVFVFVGLTDSSQGQRDALLVKTSPYGEFEWGQIHGGSGNDIANSVIQTDEGELVFIGSTISFGAGRRDAWLVKTSSLGFMHPLRFLSDLISYYKN